MMLGFLLGIGMAHTYPICTGYVVSSLMFFVLAGLRRRSLIGLGILMLFGFSFGWWRGSVYMHRLADYAQYYGHPVIIRVIAQEDAIYGSRSQLTFHGRRLIVNNGQRLNGRITISGFGARAVFAGDEIEVSGKLRSGYGAYQGTLSFATLTVLSHHNSLINETRRRFAAGMQSALPEPLASFAMGLLVGQRATLPVQVKQDLLMVGLTHIIAVSGYNLTIILQASKRLFAKQSKRIAVGLSLGLIIVFLALAGASASIVRAAIVSTLSIVTNFYGRSMPPLNLIVIAAAITAWANPVYVWSDISWYLSFLAFFGVMVLAPLISERLRFKHKDSVLVAVAIESICAETMSLPIVLYIFGQMSLIGLPANVLVVALVPLAMLLSLFAGLAGLLAPTLAGWIAWPAKALLNYMLDISHLLANLPHIFIENLALPLGQMLIWYAGILAFVAALWFKSETRSAILTDVNDELY